MLYRTLNSRSAHICVKMARIAILPEGLGTAVCRVLQPNSMSDVSPDLAIKGL